VEPNCEVESHKSLAKAFYAIDYPSKINYILIGDRATNTVTQRNYQTSLALDIKASFVKMEIEWGCANFERSRVAWVRHAIMNTISVFFNSFQL
jgi:hypothetical protein